MVNYQLVNYRSEMTLLLPLMTVLETLAGYISIVADIPFCLIDSLEI